MLERNEKTYAIIGAAMEVHRVLGSGFTEYVYQDAFEIELMRRGIPYEREKNLKVKYKDTLLKGDYFADFVCYGDIIVELKAVAKLNDIHRAQIFNYIKIQGWNLGLLFNFGETSLIFERIFIDKNKNRLPR